MKFETAFFDKTLWETFISMGENEGLITDDLYDARRFISKKIYFDNKDKVLLYLVLFDKIYDIGSDVDYDLSRFHSEGLLKYKNDLDYISHPVRILWNLRSDPKANIEEIYLYNSALEILRNRKAQILNYIFQFYSFNDLKIASNAFDQIINVLEGNIDVDKEDFAIGYYSYFIEIVEDIFYIAYIGISDSIKGKSIFASSLDSQYISKSSHIQTTDIIDEFYYLAEIKLTDEIKYLPKPDNFEEAFYFRNKKEIKDFRNVMSLWLDSFHQGNINIEEKLRKDLRKANNALKKLKYIKEYKETKICFWIDAIGGHLPIFSHILNAVNTGIKIYEPFARKQSNWVKLTAHNNV
ncbi:hypothetical protein GTQ34_09830 [Muricauda sp. JGD-17]|uniref:Uncharacterized protein n=1 Tax=Flagellimonas ochracea TaxID=2696472 RepID=A0A964TC90_9FLAO|nr:hypothetical protein [Allomuricauda ochracea]NAY92218.1 hypothetical protein [Allomuricauda ochracea]